ncbi:DMT family transporter [Rhodoplanes sp. TEM]|uniref:DMT family transporter n=1 Tax=Rhodoplanes tepidamans TaxID=200616 RepID=A0ABT5JB74_RHOTP|nr:MULTISPECIES: DMT family transporter [Rhodoplanes]MDC7786852.1 DMT family transporter [Rhodoplanes tepidamans]MDC7984219.1 DMT family transporter [Rhodoplanes sp. TEM]MDQ0355980.1 drug/metabolite transporter (DMT)-like permease [Rhodoplanes tepidamans]
MRQRPLLTMSPGDWAMLVALSTLWGASYYFAKVAVAEVPPMTISLIRVAVAAPIMLALCRQAGELAQMPRYWLPFLVMGFLSNAAAFALISWSQLRIGSGLAAVLNATTPLFAIVLAHLTTRDDRITPARAAGLLLGLAGVAVMIGPGALAGLGGHIGGELACLLAAFLYAVGAIYARRYKHLSPNVMGGGQAVAAIVLMLPPVLLLDQPWRLPAPSWPAVAALLALGAFSTALAYVLYFRVLSRAGATNTLLVTFLIPVSAMLLGTVLMDERLEPHQIAGMLGIAAGLVAIDGRAWRAFSEWRRGRKS